MASSGTPSSSRVVSGSRSQRRTASQPTQPTMPPVSGGRPGIGSVASAATVSRNASSGLPPVGTPTGGSPIQCVTPSRAVRVARLAAPTMLQRDHTPPCSADSSRKVPGGSLASLR